MTFTEQEVQWIVAEVIRRLGLAANGQTQHAAGGELVLTDKLITMRTIEGRLNGAKQLSVPAKAVVTPAVRDELKRRNVELVRQKA
jgi:hypothetical protein